MLDCIILACFMLLKGGDVNHLRLLVGGLHLDSAATQHTEAGALLWLHCPMHRGQLTTAPSLPSMPDKERFRAMCVLPEHGLLAQNLATQLERYRVGKPSLFSSGEVPKPTHKYSHTGIQNRKGGGASSSRFRTEVSAPKLS